MPDAQPLGQVAAWDMKTVGWGQEGDGESGGAVGSETRWGIHRPWLQRSKQAQSQLGNRWKSFGANALEKQDATHPTIQEGRGKEAASFLWIKTHLERSSAEKQTLGSQL